MRVLAFFFLCLTLSTASARMLTTGSFVANPGMVVSVPLAADALADVGAATVVLNYDSTVVSCLGVETGEAVSPEKMTYADTGAGQIVLVISGFRKESGTLATVRLLAREGTQGLYSDVTIAEADLAAKDGLTDLAVANPVTTVNGMIRVVATSADVSRLENAFAVNSKTTLKNLTLEPGDAVMASDDRTAISVLQSVSAIGPITVVPPVNGWNSGTYAILSTPTAGLEFHLEGATNAVVRLEASGGITTYYADVTVEGEVSVVAESGEIPVETVAQIRTQLADDLAAHPEVKNVVVKGDLSLVPVIVDLGIVPRLDILGTTLEATYNQPTIAITAFDPQTGNVRIKVTPGDGNAIRTVLVSGCIHVYGTSDLTLKMRYISGTSVDLTPYLKEETKGEANLAVALGSHTFIKVKAETLIKKEGETE